MYGHCQCFGDWPVDSLDAWIEASKFNAEMSVRRPSRWNLSWIVMKMAWSRKKGGSWPKVVTASTKRESTGVPGSARARR